MLGPPGPSCFPIKSETVTLGCETSNPGFETVDPGGEDFRLKNVTGVCGGRAFFTVRGTSLSNAIALALSPACSITLMLSPASLIALASSPASLIALALSPASSIALTLSPASPIVLTLYGGQFQNGRGCGGQRQND